MTLHTHTREKFEEAIIMKLFVILTALFLLLPEISVAFVSTPTERTALGPLFETLERSNNNRQHIVAIGYPFLLAISIIGGVSEPAWGVEGFANNPAFQLLPREPSIPQNASPMQRATEQIRQLTDLQDEMLEKCADKGEFWEQCFYYGMRDDEKRIDFQWGSPEAALEPPKASQGILSFSPSAGSGGGEKNNRPPTW